MTRKRRRGPKPKREHGMYACTGEGCGICRRSERLRAYWRGRRAQGIARHHSNWSDWTAEEDAFLTQRAGHVSLAQIARELHASGLSPEKRSRRAIQLRGRLLGLDYRPLDYTTGYLAGLLGVHPSTVADVWIKRGWLQARVWETKNRVVSHEAVEQFLRDCGWLYDVQAIRGITLRAYAARVQHRDPWLPVRELATYMGTGESAVRRWRKWGLVPFRVRPSRGGQGGSVYVRASDFPRIKEAVLRDLERRQALRTLHMKEAVAQWLAQRKDDAA